MYFKTLLGVICLIFIFAKYIKTITYLYCLHFLAIIKQVLWTYNLLCIFHFDYDPSIDYIYVAIAMLNIMSSLKIDKSPFLDKLLCKTCQAS